MSQSVHNRWQELYAADARRDPRYHSGRQPWTITDRKAK